MAPLLVVLYKTAGKPPHAHPTGAFQKPTSTIVWVVADVSTCRQVSPPLVVLTTQPRPAMLSRPAAHTVVADAQATPDHVWSPFM